MSENINHPAHYTGGDVECIDGLEAALGRFGFMSYCRGNAMKYLWRCDKKDDLETDLRKARWYIDRMLDTIGEA